MPPPPCQAPVTLPLSEGGLVRAWHIPQLLEVFEPIRWITLHPALVHLPLGSFPVAALAYLVAARRGSERWSFAGDVALIFAALSITVAAGLGLLAYFLVPWPGGLAPWPTVHLVLGVSSTLLALGLLGWRLWRRKRQQHVGGAWASAVVAVTVLIFFTGWVGGEVLAFHAGIAVRAAGLGALAPAISWPDSPPENLGEGMGRLRSAWGAATSRLSAMVVERPSPEQYAGLAKDARHMQEVALWIIGRGAEPPEPGAKPSQAHGVGGGGTAGGADEAHEHEHEHGSLAPMAKALLQQAKALEQAAEQRNLARAAEQLGSITSTCSGCHLMHRWSGR